MTIKLIKNLLIGRWQERLSIEARIRILIGFGILAWGVAFFTLVIFLIPAPFYLQVIAFSLVLLNGVSFAGIGLWCFSLRDPRDNHMPTNPFDWIFWVLFFIGVAPVYGLQYWINEGSEIYPLLGALMMVFTVPLIRMPASIGFLVITFMTMIFAVGSESNHPIVYWFTLWGIGLACWSVVLSTNMELLGQRELRASNDQLQLAQNTIEHIATRQERLRIGRDLHDQMGHNLTALLLQLQICAKLVEQKNYERLLPHIDKAQHNTQELFDELRQVVHKLRVEGETGFITALKELTEGFDGLRIRVIDNLDAPFPPLQASDDLIYCIKECITNTLKHSNASELKIQFSRTDNEILLEVMDNGTMPPRGKQGYGLQGSAERLRAWHGQLDFGFHQGQGFQVLMKLPLGTS